MQIIDVSWPIHSGMLCWPGVQEPVQEWHLRMERGDPCNISNWKLGVHTGTHLDSPVHFIPDGDDLESGVPLETLFGPAVVLDVSDRDEHVTRADLERAGGVGAHSRVLLRTANSRLRLETDRFDPHHAGLATDAAEYLVEHGVRCVGTDYLGIEPYDHPQALTHQLLFAAGVAVIEGLDLRHVRQGEYFMACLPLRLLHADGAPARALLVPLGDWQTAVPALQA